MPAGPGSLPVSVSRAASRSATASSLRAINRTATAVHLRAWRARQQPVQTGSDRTRSSSDFSSMPATKAAAASDNMRPRGSTQAGKWAGGPGVEAAVRASESMPPSVYKTCICYHIFCIYRTYCLNFMINDNLALSLIFLIKEELRKSPTKTVSITLRKTKPCHMAPRFPLMFRRPDSRPGAPLTEAIANLRAHLRDLTDPSTSSHLLRQYPSRQHVWLEACYRFVPSARPLLAELKRHRTSSPHGVPFRGDSDQVRQKLRSKAKQGPVAALPTQDRYAERQAVD